MNAQAIRCNKPEFQPGDQHTAPIALSCLLLFALLWGGASGVFAYHALQADQFSTEVRAVFMPNNNLRYYDSEKNGGGHHEIDPPEGWQDYLEANQTVRLRIVQGSIFAPSLAATTRSHLILGTAFFLFTPVLFYLAYHTLKRMRADAARRQRMTELNLRLPATALYSSAEDSSESEPCYRAIVVFLAPDGRLYEVISDPFDADPSAELSLAGLEVLFDRQYPKQSMVAMDCPAIKAYRQTMLAKSRQT
jgi:hypothetical protein